MPEKQRFQSRHVSTQLHIASKSRFSLLLKLLVPHTAFRAGTPAKSLPYPLCTDVNLNVGTFAGPLGTDVGKWRIEP